MVKREIGYVRRILASKEISNLQTQLFRLLALLHSSMTNYSVIHKREAKILIVGYRLFLLFFKPDPLI